MPLYDEEENDAPWITCPGCGNEFCIEDAFEFDEGSEHDCPECNAHLVCNAVETIRRWTWGVEVAESSTEAQKPEQKD